MTGMWIFAFISLAAVVVLLAVVVLGLLRRLEPLMEQSQMLLSASARRLTIGGLPPGSTVRPFAAHDVRGAPFTDLDLRGATNVVLFLDDGCAACDRLFQRLETGRVPDVRAPLLVVTNTVEGGRRLALSDDVTVVVDGDRLVARAFESAVSPQAFVVDGYGRVLASETPTDWDQLASVVTAAKGGDLGTDPSAAYVPSRNAKEVIS